MDEINELTSCLLMPEEGLWEGVGGPETSEGLSKIWWEMLLSGFLLLTQRRLLS